MRIMFGLTEEQKKRIEENKRKALEKLQARKLASKTCQNNAPTHAPVFGTQPSISKNDVSVSHKKTIPSTSFTFREQGKSCELPLQKVTTKQQETEPSTSKNAACTESYTPTKPTCPISFSPFKRQRQSPLGLASTSSSSSLSSSSSVPSARKNISSFYNNEQSTKNTQKGMHTNKCSVQEVKQKSNNSDDASATVYPKGYCSPPQSTEMIYLTLSMKNCTWFRVEHKSSHQNAIGIIAKQIANRQYDMSCGCWSFHIKDYQTVVKAFKNGLKVSIDTIPSNVVSILQETHHNRDMCNDTDLTNIGSDILEKLMPFQRDGILFGIKKKGRLLIADDMGLGKTVQAIALCAYYKGEWPVLVICPSSVKMSWKQHFISWIPSIIEGDINIVKNGKEDPTIAKINIVSYELASRLVSIIHRKKFKIMIADECHFLKNHAAARTKNIVPLLQGARRAILLSGTPALSRPKELFTQIKALDKNIFPEYHKFSLRYCNARQTGYGWDDSGSSNDAELQAVLSSTLMIRRMKEEVLHQLPEKRRQVVLLDPSMIKTTKDLKNNERAFLDSRSDKKCALISYFQKSCDAKIKGVCEYLSEKIEAHSKMIVFAHHGMMLDAIEFTAIKKKVGYIRIDGSTVADTRQGMVDHFNTASDCLLAILSITACGTGLNITGSSNVIFAELYWNPGQLKQAEDRAYRIGQKNCVSVIYLVAKKTADDYIWPMVQKKLKVLTNLGVGTEKGFEAKTTNQETCTSQSVMLDFFDKLIEEDDKDFLNGIDIMEEKKENETNGVNVDVCNATSTSTPVEGVETFAEDLIKPEDWKDFLHEIDKTEEERENEDNRLNAFNGTPIEHVDTSTDDLIEPACKRSKVL